MSIVPTSPGIPPRDPPRPRQRERRAGLDGLLASLTPALRWSAGALLRPTFEEAATGSWASSTPAPRRASG